MPKSLACINSFNPYNSREGSTVILILQLRKLRHGRFKYLARTHSQRAVEAGLEPKQLGRVALLSSTSATSAWGLPQPGPLPPCVSLWHGLLALSLSLIHKNTLMLMREAFTAPSHRPVPQTINPLTCQTASETSPLVISSPKSSRLFSPPGSLWRHMGVLKGGGPGPWPFWASGGNPLIRPPWAV